MRRRDLSTAIKLVAVVCAGIVGLVSCQQNGGGRRSFVISDSNSYEASLYRSNCAICHGPEAYGKTVDGTEVPGLRFGTAKTKSEEEIYQQIAHGKLPMPSFQNQLTEGELRRMARFIFRDVQGRDDKKKKE